MIQRLKIRLLQRFLARHPFLLFVESVLIWLFLVLAIVYAISFLVIPTVAEANLEKLCGGAVDIQSGRLKGFGAIRLRGVVIGENEQAISNTPILKADQIDVQFNLRQLLKGNFIVHSVILSDVLLSADYDTSLQKWNLSGLAFQKTNTSTGRMPLLTIHNGAVQVRQKGVDDLETLATVGINGQIAVSDNENEYDFMLETDGRFGFGKSKLQGGYKIGNDGKQSQFFAGGQIIMPAAGILQNKWDLKDIRLEGTVDEKTIAIETFRFSMGQGEGKANALIHRTGNRAMELSVNLHGFTLSDRFDPGTVSYSWLIKSSNSGFARFIRRFHPTGNADLQLSIKGNLADLSQTQLDGTIQCEDMAICDDTFPYRIENMKGEIELAGQTIRLKQIQARHGDVHLQLDGQVTNAGSQRTIDFRLTSPDMLLDTDLYQSLPEKIKKVWYDFTPEGLAGVDYHYQKTLDSQERIELELELKNTTATYRRFPYPLDNLTGKIIYRPHQLLIHGLLASYDNGSKIKVSGRVLQEEQDESVFDVHIEGEDIPIDQQLIRILPDKSKSFLNNFEIDKTNAVSNFNVKVFPDKEDDQFLDYSAEIEVKGAAFQYDAFPLPMTDVELAATITKDVVTLDSLRAQTENGPIHIGTSRVWSQGTDPNHPGICLDLNLNGFDLNETFWDAAGAETRHKLGQFGIRGRIDAAGQLAVNVPKTECGITDLVIDCNDNPLSWDNYALGQASGRLNIRDDGVLFSDFEVSDISPESLPKEGLPEKAAQILTQVAPKGKMSIRLEDGVLNIRPDGAKRIDVHARITANELSLGQTNTINGLEGDCRGHFVYDFETGQPKTQARYDINRFVYRNRLVTDFRGDLVFDPNSMQLESKEFVAAVYDGDISGNLRINLSADEEARYELELSYDNVNMHQFLATGGEKSPLQTTQGSASGRLALEGNIGDFSTSRGTFEAKIVDLKMGQQSLIGKILTAIQLKQPENFVFNEIALSAAVVGPELIFNHIRMLGNPLMFYGKGSVNLQNRRIEITLASWDKKFGSQETILDTLARGISAALWKIQVRGTLEKPEVDAVFLSVLKQPLDIFKKQE